MMRKYVVAYAVWLVAVLAMATVAAAWYKHVEEIGARELLNRLRDTEATEDTDSHGGA